MAEDHDDAARLQDVLQEILDSEAPDPAADPALVTVPEAPPAQLPLTVAQVVTQEQAPTPAKAEAGVEANPLLAKLIDETIAGFNRAEAEIMENCRRDRAQQEEFYQLCHDRVNNQDGMVNRVFVEGMMNVLATKADTTQVMVRALDARTKLLAALRAPIQIQNNQLNAAGGAGGKELEGILAAPYTPDLDES